MSRILYIPAGAKGQITINKVVRDMVRTSRYGCLYNWYAATDARGIAPTGWHMPTKTEWETLETTLGGTSVAGGHLKEDGTAHWTFDNADNSSGFTLLPNGQRLSSGTFRWLTTMAYIWTATSYSSTLAWCKYYYNSDTASYTSYENKVTGKCIRLLCDSSTDPGIMVDFDGNIYPTVKIGNQVWMAANLIVEHFNNGEDIPDVSDDTAWGNLTTAGMCYYNNDATNAYIESEGELTTDATVFEVTITGQKANPRIATKVVSQQAPAVFTKLPFDTYVITEALKAGYNLSGISPSQVVLSGGNKTAQAEVTNILNTTHYGLLYNWYAVTDIRGIAPSGWHVPTQSEFATLTTNLGGLSSAGGKLKETGYTYWKYPNTGATNEVGFNGIGAGYRLYNSGFQHLKTGCVIWSTTIAFTGYARFLGFIINDNLAEISPMKFNYGISVRLIKDDSDLEDGTMTDFDGNVYPTVQIGTQIWMAANLIVKHYNNGEDIPNVTDDTAWENLITGAYCAYNNDNNNV